MEIERKYLLDALPCNIDRWPHNELEQSYLCTSPTVRIRRVDDSYILTVKERAKHQQSTALCNREEEFDLSPQAYAHLKAKSDAGEVSKTRYRIDLCESEGDIRYKGLVAEVDVFHGCHEGLMLVEVEFDSEEEAMMFEPPSWFGADVSQDPRYRNTYLAAVDSL